MDRDPASSEELVDRPLDPEDAVRELAVDVVVPADDPPGSDLAEPRVEVLLNGLVVVAGVDEDVVMPPEGTRLTAAEVGILRAWIDQGANWPDELAGKVEDKRDWWSLKPLAKPAVPRVADSGIRNPIDAFIRDRLKTEGYNHSPEADRRTLIRRLYFDLIGLPPSPEELADGAAY